MKVLRVREKFESMTQKLDHTIPDLMLSKEMNQRAAQELKQISEQLYDALPDPSLSPLERIERLARVVAHSIIDFDQLQSAHRKLGQIREKLDQLVPGDHMSIGEKVDFLLELLDRAVPGNGSPVQKLEYLGDPRVPVGSQLDLRPNPEALAS